MAFVSNGSQNSTASKFPHANLKIFTTPKMECRQTVDKPLTWRCSSLRRLCTASMYIDAVTASKLDDDTKRTLLVEFNEEIYNMMLDDTKHLVTKHSDHIQQIQKEWIENYGFPKQYGFQKCTVSNCTKTTRHYGRGRRDKSTGTNDANERDPLYEFHRSLYDQVHHFVWHLYDIGLRVDINSLGLNKGGSDEKEAETEGVTVDHFFAAERDCIRTRRGECQLDLDRFQEAISKYTIQSVMRAASGVTLMDILFQKLSENVHITTKAQQQIKQYFQEDSYDTDCIEMDIEDVADSNICRLMQNESVIQVISALIQTTECMLSDFPRSTTCCLDVTIFSVHYAVRSRAFSTGFIFNYWNQERPQWVNEDMSVSPKFNSLREEILESGFLSLSTWEKRVLLKAQKYLKSKAVKKLTANRAHKASFTGQHAMSTPVTLEHLMAIILYCDFGPLCTAFSATFRLQNVFESIESLKQRHSEFAIFGRLLVELVVDFGQNNYDQGCPVYCGLNSALNIGSYAVRMKGPCSTSTKRSVAVNFAKSDGVIIKLKHDGDSSAKQCFFDCSWISCFFEESERLWIAGQWPLQIVTIIVVRSAKNYQKVMRALYLFDTMISGVKMYGDVKEEQSDYHLLSNLMNMELNHGRNETSEFDGYIQNEWTLFLQNKQEIAVDLDSICDCFNKYLSKLMLFKVIKNRGGTAKEKENLLRPQLLSLFPELRTLRINTRADAYQFQLLPFLQESMQFMRRSVKVIVRDQGDWIQRNLTDDVVTAFEAAGWCIEYKDKPEWELIIESKRK